MIGYLRGAIIARYDAALLLDVQGVGYDISCTARTLDALAETGNHETALHIFTQVREDSLKLFGFATSDEKKLFLTLTKISGVGASVALALMSVMDTQTIIAAALAADAKAFTAAQGVGPKLASRIANELRTMPEIKNGLLGTTSPSGISSAISKPDEKNAGAEAIAALTSLGYARTDAFRSVNTAAQDTPDATAEQLITRALQLLSA